MNQKKNKSKIKQTNVISRKKLVKIFFLIFLFTFLASTVSYVLMKNKPIEKVSTNDNILQTNETSQLKKNKDTKDFTEIKPEQYFDELSKQDDSKNTDDKHEKFEEYTQEFEKEIIKDEIIKPILEIKNELENKIKAKEPIIKNNLEETKKEEIKEIQKIDEKKIITKKDTYIYNKNDKPKLAILIDDVSTLSQKKKILDIGYTVNMAFLPPTKYHKDSAKIAQDLPFHMIHFPLQASSSFKGFEIDTLKITDSYEVIEKRVKQLREWYPNAIYTNNHTGSVFTQNEEAVDKLFKALKKYNFIFVDSRTSSKSVIKKYAKKYDMPYIVRNTFIDNEREYSYIQNQLKKSVEIAKKQGFAIAIGHPHNITLQVLKESKHLLKDVETIYINKLPYL